MAADGHLGYTKNGHNFATSLPIDVLFASSVGFSGTTELVVQLSNMKNPRWRYTRTAVARNPCVSWAFLFGTPGIIKAMSEAITQHGLSFEHQVQGRDLGNVEAKNFGFKLKAKHHWVVLIVFNWIRFTAIVTPSSEHTHCFLLLCFAENFLHVSA